MLLKRILAFASIATLAPVASAPAHTRTPTIVPPSVTPVEDSAFAVGFTGDATGLKSRYPQLFARIRPSGGTPCAPNARDDPGPHIDGSFGSGVDAIGPFSVSGSYEAPAPGSYLVCAWIEDEYNDFGPPASATVAVRAPMLSISATAPASVLRGVPFAVNVSYQSEVPRYLTVLVVHATNCSIGSDALRAISSSTAEIVRSTAVSGAGASSGSARFDAVGTYLVCGFLEESSDGSGVAQHGAQLATVSVGMPAPAFRRCGSVGGRRRIRDVRARITSCAEAKSLARRWGRARRAPTRLGAYRCSARSGNVTCTSGARQVRFGFGRR